jgi:hypothetical protein
MAKKDDEVTRLQKEIRELKALNRSLLKRLKKVDRNYVEETDPHEEAIEARKSKKQKEELQDKCRRCERGRIISVEVLGREFERCDTCDYRSKAQKI